MIEDRKSLHNHQVEEHGPIMLRAAPPFRSPRLPWDFSFVNLGLDLTWCSIRKRRNADRELIRIPVPRVLAQWLFFQPELEIALFEHTRTKGDFSR